MKHRYLRTIRERDQFLFENSLLKAKSEALELRIKELEKSLLRARNDVNKFYEISEAKFRLYEREIAELKFRNESECSAEQNNPL